MPETVRLQAAAAPAAVNTDTREIAGVVLPWNTPGNTSIGRVRFRPGSVSWPADPARVKLTREHDRTAPRGYAQTITDTGDGLSASFHAAATPDGDTALTEAIERLRDGLSVDLDDVEIRGGWVESARLVAVGQVAVPAFEDARIAASDTDPAPDEDHAPESDDHDNSDENETAAPDAPGTDTDENGDETVPENATVPAPLRAARAPATVQGIQRMSDLYAALSASHTGRATAEVTAALQNITRTANAWAQATQYEGELWNGVAYQRVIVPLISSKPLTGWKVSGWRWQVAPVVAPYTGDKTPVPSNAAVTEPVEVEADRLAGAHDIDRKFRDFGDTAFFESYYAAMTESYAYLSDGAALADLQSAATAYTAGAGDTEWQTILAMAMSVQDAKHTGATFALVGKNVATGLAGTTAQNAPAFLDLIGGLPTIRYSPLLDDDGILVGIKAGATFYELPGVPIRVEAVDMVNGGIDAGVFGYYATNVHSPDAFAYTDLTPLP